MNLNKPGTLIGEFIVIKYLLAKSYFKQRKHPFNHFNKVFDYVWFHKSKQIEKQWLGQNSHHEVVQTEEKI